MMAPKPRARDLGLPFRGTPGPHNAITDVAGVHVGFTTLTDPAFGIRTGVTAIIPRGGETFPKPVWAGQYALNGNGEMTGTHWIRCRLFCRSGLHHQHPFRRHGSSRRNTLDDRHLRRLFPR